MSQHRPAGNVKGFFDKFDRLMEAETFFLAHKSYIDADNVLRQIVCSSSSFKQAFFWHCFMTCTQNTTERREGSGNRIIREVLWDIDEEMQHTSCIGVGRCTDEQEADGPTATGTDWTTAGVHD